MFARYCREAGFLAVFEQYCQTQYIHYFDYPLLLFTRPVCSCAVVCNWHLQLFLCHCQLIDEVAWSVGMSVCLCWSRSWALQNGWTDRDAVYGRWLGWAQGTWRKHVL